MLILDSAVAEGSIVNANPQISTRFSDKGDTCVKGLEKGSIQPLAGIRLSICALQWLWLSPHEYVLPVGISYPSMRGIECRMAYEAVPCVQILYCTLSKSTYSSGSTFQETGGEGHAFSPDITYRLK